VKPKFDDRQNKQKCVDTQENQYRQVEIVLKRRKDNLIEINGAAKGQTNVVVGQSDKCQSDKCQSDKCRSDKSRGIKINYDYICTNFLISSIFYYNHVSASKIVLPET
jgi:hypothetical protein